MLHRHVPGSDDASVIALAPGLSGKLMQPFIIRPTEAGVTRATHAGEELIVVLRGEVLIRLGETEMVLRTGDSLYFAASIEHTIRRIGAARADLLVVVARGGGEVGAGG
ncbi:MAG: hypothetical protein QOH05_1206 [Acetobacteraceae bacterium]|jgi:uncharacterized cupin superfamily protein|nr:hypothetical protein [Acetobacteraceae bacterium]